MLAVFSKQIVFPGLEILLGIETIMGKGNVSYNPDGSYVFTNPGAMVAWVAGVCALGLCVVAAGIVLLVRSRRNRMPTNWST